MATQAKATGDKLWETQNHVTLALRRVTMSSNIITESEEIVLQVQEMKGGIFCFKAIN